jgi:hypothetical protein
MHIPASRIPAHSASPCQWLCAMQSMEYLVNVLFREASAREGRLVDTQVVIVVRGCMPATCLPNPRPLCWRPSARLHVQCWLLGGCCKRVSVRGRGTLIRMSGLFLQDLSGFRRSAVTSKSLHAFKVVSGLYQEHFPVWAPLLLSLATGSGLRFQWPCSIRALPSPNT